MGKKASEESASAKVGSTKNSIQVITRAVRVLRALEGEPEGLSLGQIALRVGLARSTVQRIVDALRAEQFVIAASLTAGVRLGPALIRLAASASVEFDQITRPIMSDLSKAVGETVDCPCSRAAWQSSPIRCKACTVCAVSSIGESFPLHCTANGKAIMSVLSDEKVTRLLKNPLPRLTLNTITKPAELLKDIQACRRTGIAFDNEEHTVGISAIGTGFLDPMGRALGLSIPVPTTRFGKIQEKLQAHLLAARARTLEALGESAL